METGNQTDARVGHDDAESEMHDVRTEFRQILGTSDFASITKLELSKFVYIHAVFQEFLNLQVLSLKDGWIREIANLHLMTKLHTLDLSNNKIDNLDGIEHNINLRTLILDNNPIIFLKESTFSPLTNLSVLSLRETDVYNLCQTVETLSTLPQLQHLHFQSVLKPKEVDTPKSLSQYFFSQENAQQAMAILEMLNVNSMNALQSLRDRIIEQHQYLMNFAQITQTPAIQGTEVPAPTELENLGDIGENFDYDEEPEISPVREIDEESKAIEKAYLEQSKVEPELDVDSWDTTKSSPLCNEPKYRAYLTHLLPQIISLDGIDIEPTEREKAKIIYELHFESLPYNTYKPINLAKLLTQRETNFSHKYRNRELEYASHYGRHKQPRLHKLCHKLTFTPRQFEYNPCRPDRMVFGTTSGEIVVLNPHSDTIVGTVPPLESCNVLGLCWLHNSHGESKFIAGCDNGEIKLLDVNLLECGRNPVVHSYDRFPHLSSATVNCTDEFFLTSGHTNSIHMYDLKTSKLVQVYSNIHNGYINVSKFSNHSPFLFATSSFDRSVKLWDMREKGNKPIFTRTSYEGIVMVTWSPDDKYLLTSATDNEVRQYLSVDGKLDRRFDIKRTNSNYNYTRSYYMGPDYVIVGSCEESVVRIYNSKTGKLFRDVEFNTVPSRHIKYVQSLRGDPFHPFSFTALIAHKPPGIPFDLTKVDLMEREYL